MKFEVWVLQKGQTEFKRLFSYDKEEWAKRIKEELASSKLYRKIEIRPIMDNERTLTRNLP